MIQYFYLNTSHVLIYPDTLASPDTSALYLNTSHVLIYRQVVKLQDGKLQFKYISCSYLSSLAWLSAFGFANLNTSHVLIYHTEAQKRASIKYNLNTSHVLIYQPQNQEENLEGQNLNTSHVLIYL